ncbi:hypothetical protein BD289DRAFT_442377 [Coniella lustricola]|uniref:Uncharacterized protein n=1 Tax=Coniella lustricola TaxID=2025994 RepID=A0A2T2ZY74_9PEZI|nr:hypothetical protein BD289DRAFT_442377 [Coniella lustricola]
MTRWRLSAPLFSHHQTGRDRQTQARTSLEREKANEAGGEHEDLDGLVGRPGCKGWGGPCGALCRNPAILLYML